MSESPTAEPPAALPGDPGAEYLASLDPPALEAIVEAMVLVARADGVLSSAERERLAANVAQLMHGRKSSEQLAEWLETITRRVADASPAERLASLAERLTDPTARQVAVVLAADVAAADGVLRGEELASCLALAAALGIERADALALGIVGAD